MPSKEKTDDVVQSAMPVKTAAVYTVDELLASSKEAFGVQPEVIVGALHFQYKGSRNKFTKVEVKSAIEAFKKKEVK